MMRLPLLVLSLFVVAGSVPAAAGAHEVRPALLEVMRGADAVCRIQWKQPMAGNAGVRLRPRLSGAWTAEPPLRLVRAPGHVTSFWQHARCTPADLESQRVAVEGLDATITDVLVRIDYGDGDVRQQMLHPGDPALSLTRRTAAQSPAAAYFGLGLEHILEGVDHLAFMGGLILVVGLRRRLVAVVTCFTLAHSLTLGMTALGAVAPRPALIEALVALSIVFVAAEALHARAGRDSLAIRHPELIALAFGLLHGFAFAGALAEIGLPRGERLLALALFNLGVEAGQLLFLGVVWLLAALASRLHGPLPRWATTAPAYAIGSTAGFWFLERVAAAFSPEWRM